MPHQGRELLKTRDISIQEVLDLSYEVYGKEVDNKARRMSIDIINTNITARKNLNFNPETETWEQTGRGVRIDFVVRSNPLSYKKRDTVPIHKYPVTFLIDDIDKGLKSAFRWRTGSIARYKKPDTVPPNASPEAKKAISAKNLRTLNQNIINGIQLQFFFDLEYVLGKYGLLFGPDLTNHLPPKKRNFNEYPFFDKTALFCVVNVLIHFLTTKKGYLDNLFKNPNVN